MKSFNKNINGERIKQARLYRGLSQAELAERLEVSKQAISRYEKNDMNLATNIIAKLPNALGFPLSFFSKEFNFENKNKDAIYFRTKEIPRKTKDSLEVKIKLLDEEIISYLDNYIGLPEHKLPDLSKYIKINKYNYDREEIKKICKEIREFWGLGDEPIDNLSYVLQSNGYIINKQNISQNKTDGFSQYFNNRNYIFISANKGSAVRSRFDLAHELGHLVMHINIDSEELGGKVIERDADYFASEFIYPEESFINDIQGRSLNFDTFIKLKEKWKISIQAIIRKCRDLDLISEDKYTYFQKRISYNKWRIHEPLDDIIISEEPRLLKDALELLIENNILTKEKLLRDLDIYADDVIKLCNLPEDYFESSFDNIIKLF